MKLHKFLWTEQDFDALNWHDATLYGLGFQAGKEHWQGTLLIDVDYILKWVPPPEGGTYFQFWVAPATLIFKDVSALEGDLQTQSFPPRLEAIRRTPAGRPEAASMGYEKWVLDGHDFELSFLSRGFKQIFRRAPTLTSTQSLELSGRGGVSFSVDLPSAE